MAAYSEGLALTEAAGLDAKTMIEVISQGAVACPMFALKGPKMIEQDYAPNFPLRHATKDMTLAKDLANKVGVEYSVMNQAESLFRVATDDKELNIADEDFSSIFETIHKESTNDVSKKRKKMS